MNANTEETTNDGPSSDGHQAILTRKFNTWSILALGFCVLGTWAVFAQDLASGLNNGGPVSIIWGLVLVAICNLCVSLSLGELCSSMPTALGQAYWISRLWTTTTGRFASYLCAWITTFGWLAISASAIAFMANFLLGMKVMFRSDWAGASTGWVEFLVYIGITLAGTVFNIVACRRDRWLPLFNDLVGVSFFLLFVGIAIVLLTCVGLRPDLHFQSGSFVFGEWINASGWSNGVTWFIGLVQSAYGLTAFDSIIHMIEELPDPRRNGPKAILLTIVCSAITGLLFMIVCLFCIQDVNRVIDTPTGLPFIRLIQDATGLDGGAAVIALFIANGLGQAMSCMTTSSRLTWGFARDGGIPLSSYFSHIDPYWKVPVRALWLQGATIGLIGVLYLFATTVLDAVLSVSTIALTISYAMPILALLIVGRDKLPPGGKFSLGKWGMPVNIISLIYCFITTVFFFFPGSPSPSPSDMNYAIAIFGVMFLMAVGFWFISGRSSFLICADHHDIIDATQLPDDLTDKPEAFKSEMYQGK